ncbi:MAG: hypothetical protein E7496_04200 [Ruminococcus sp.]|nr:hypothetical protein [Ruminococcus sp.]
MEKENTTTTTTKTNSNVLHKCRAVVVCVIMLSLVIGFITFSFKPDSTMRLIEPFVDYIFGRASISAEEAQHVTKPEKEDTLSFSLTDAYAAEKADSQTVLFSAAKAPAYVNSVASCSLSGDFHSLTFFRTETESEIMHENMLLTLVASADNEKFELAEKVSIPLNGEISFPVDGEAYDTVEILIHAKGCGEASDDAVTTERTVTCRIA